MAISANPLNGGGLGEAFSFIAASTSGSIVPTFTTALAVGQTLILLGAASATQGLVTVSQTGVRWTLVKRNAAALANDVWIGYVDGLTGAPSTTINFTTLVNGSVIAQRLCVSQETGLGSWTPLHATNTTTATSMTCDAGSVTPTAGQEVLCFSVARVLSGAAQNQPTDTAWHNLATSNNGAYFGRVVLTSVGLATSCAWSIANVQWEATTVCFRATTAIVPTIDALVAVLDPTDPSPAGKCKIVRDCRVQALTATEPGVNIVTGQAHRWNDYRQQSSTLDAIGGGGTDALGYSLVGVQGSGTEYLHGDGTQWMASTAAIATLDLSLVPGYTIIDIVRVTANGGVGGIARSPTAATAPYCMNAVESGTFTMASNLTTSLDTAVASGSTWRIIFTQRFNLRSGVSGMNDISSGDQMHHVAMGGRTAVPQIWGNGLLANSGVEYAAGNNFDVIGRQSTNIATLDHAFHAVLATELTTAQRQAVEAWAVTNFGVTLDTSFHALIPLGASFNWGASQAGVQQTDPPLKWCVVNATGGAGTLTSRGWESNPFTLSNYGISGRTIAMTAEGIATTSLQNRNPAHPGYDVFVVWDIFYNSMKTLTAVACELEVIALLTTIAATGGKTLLATIVDGGFMYTGFTNLGTSSGVSTQGTQVLAFNALLRANWRTYPGCVGLVDLAANVNLMPDKWNGVYPNIPASAIGTYYEGGQGGHFLNGGYQLIGQIFKDYLDANPGALNPIGSSSVTRRRRRM